LKKNILITGCSSGIGYETAHYLHNNGYKVYASARDAEDVKKVSRFIAKAGGTQPLIAKIEKPVAAI